MEHAPKLTHVLQTRFSVRASWGFDEFPLDWLRERLALFDAYCMPSVAHQTCKDFTWHVYCDVETDRTIIAELEARAQELPQLQVAITGPGHSSPKTHVVRLANESDDVILTTRLDSDDAISIGYIGAIQAHAADFVAGDHRTMLLNFPRGFQLDHESGRLSFDWMPRSSFHSLFERPGEDLSTVLAGNHSKFHEIHHTVHDDSIVAWLMVIHGGNVINKLREYYTGDAERKRLAEFGLSDAALASPVDGAGAELSP